MAAIYLDVFLMKKMCHPLAAEIFDHRTDPLPAFEEYSTDKLEASLYSPRQGFGDKEFYPTLPEKAAILFYSLIQNHCFPNGNKRLGTASLLVFLYINQHWLNALDEELAQWAIRIASSGEKIPPERISDIMPDLTKWVADHLIPLKI